jgi:hypothetical protein
MTVFTKSYKTRQANFRRAKIITILFLKHCGFKKKEEFWDHVRQFEIVGLAEERGKEKRTNGCKTRKEERESCGGNNSRGKIGD